MAGESQAFLTGKMRNRRKLFRFFSFYGGKHQLASKYPPPYYDTIIEEFAGSAGYSTLHFNRKVHLFDLDPIICEVWQYLIRVEKSELLRIPIVHAWDDEQLSNWPQEVKWLVGFWLCMGQPNPYNKQTSWANTRARSSWSEEVRFKLANQVDKIRHWEIHHADYRSADGILATHFIDPPYRGPAGRKYNFGSDAIDYTDLGNYCRRQLGQIIVCESLQADWLPFEFLCKAHTSATRNKSCEGRTSGEAIYYQFQGQQVKLR